MSDEDSLRYFNCEITNNSDDFIDATFSQTFPHPEFDDARKFKFTCVRFSINTQSVPISIIEVADPSTSATVLPYSVTLESFDSGVPATYTSTASLNWVTQSDKPAPPTSSNQDLTNDFYYLWNFQHFIDIVNTALLDAYNGLTYKPVGSEAPFFEIIDGTNKIRLVAQIAHYDNNNSAPDDLIKIFINRRLLTLFEHFKGIKSDTENTKAFQFLVGNEGSNNDLGTIKRPPAAPTGSEVYYYMDQYKPSFSLFETFSRLIIVSDEPFFASESYPPGIEPFGRPRDPPNSFLAQSSRSIMTDYVVPQDGLLQSTSDTVIYVPDKYRLIDIVKKHINRITFRILWVDQYGNTYPLKLSPGTLCTFKFGFIGLNLA